MWIWYMASNVGYITESFVLISPIILHYLSLSSECVRRVSLLFLFFYLSSSNEKERPSRSSANHEDSVRTLHDPQHTNKRLSAKTNIPYLLALSNLPF